MSLRNMLERFKATPLPVPAAGGSETAIEGEILRQSDTRQPMKLGLWALGIFFGGFLLWAILAPLDEGVPTLGMVTIDTKRKTVQHLSGGVVKQVLVKEGQYVKVGEPLIKLDEATVYANYEGVRQHYLTLRAMEGRLLAEQAGIDKIAFHPDLLQAGSDPVFQQIMNNQVQLFQSRRAALKAEMQAIRESINGQEAMLKGYDGLLNSRKNQQALIQEELKGVRELVSEGYAPRNRLLELERTASESIGSIADLRGNMQRGRSSIAELKLRSAQRFQEYNKEVSAQLSEVRREVQADADKLRAVSQDLDRMTIKAPVEGQVVGLSVQSLGGVIAPGQRIVDIVPRNEALLLEARVPPHFIDRVHPGLSTDVRFNSFAHSPQLVVEGRVDSVSSDLIIDPQNPAASYYLARISITPEGLQKLGKRQLQPGMQTEVVFKTGERSVLTYLLYPLLKRMATSMKEE